jgi:hypothetical protein
MFDRLVLFSEVHGTVLKDGKPVSGAEIIEKAKWSDDADKNPMQRSITGQDGAFSFPAMERSAGLLRFIPASPNIAQTILIRYEGVEYVAWIHDKGSYDANVELDGKPINLVCELTRKPDFEGRHYGICKVV